MVSNVTFWGIADKSTWLHNQHIPRRDATRGTVIVDGKIDEAWKGAKTLDVSLAASGKPTAKARVLWDEKFPYALAEVRDSAVDAKATADYEKDSVEFFILTRMTKRRERTKPTMVNIA